MNENKLIPIENKGKRVLTTEQLAESYKTDSKVISYNFNHNKKRYTEGKHYYRLTGDELKKFLANVNFTNANKIRTLYLWTEKGALLHAKSLNTDTAWEVYDFLAENYFRVRQTENDLSDLSPQLKYLIQIEQRQKQLETKQQEMGDKLEQMQENRDELIKATLDFGRISYSQQMSITKAVKLRAIKCCCTAQAYSKVGKRVIASIYNALKEKFDVTSYRDLRMNQMTDALVFIEIWEPDLPLLTEIVNAGPKLLNLFDL